MGNLKTTPDSLLRNRRLSSGFSLVELMITVAAVLIMTAAAVPVMQSTILQFRLRGSVTTITGAIQQTRYEAISDGYQYKVTLDKASRTYQVLSDQTGAGVFKNVGPPVPFSGSATGIASDATLQFSPSGKVTFVVGASPIVVSGQGHTGKITVSAYGNVNVKYGS
jgi:type IV fimbrial biogenesis protein FimT